MDNEELEKRLDWYNKKYGSYIEKRGLHNWKNLFRKPTLQEWTILFMLIMALFISWAYQRDIELCRQALENIDEICMEYKTVYVQSNSSNTVSDINFSELNFTLET